VSGRSASIGALAVMGALLVGCGEKPQTIDMGSKRADEAWSTSSAATPAFIAPGWKVGDKTAWEEQIRMRNQAQNDYAR
jgi:hypothetical protein